jgi:hypothetical protein
LTGGEPHPGNDRHFICANKRRFRRYSGLFSAAGTVIIVVTFLIKDVLRDNAKDLVDSLESTRVTSLSLKQASIYSWSVSTGFSIDLKISKSPVIRRSPGKS